MRSLIVGAVVALALAVLLLWRSSLISRGMYRMAFLLGLAAFAAIILSPGGSWMVHTGKSALTFVSIVPLIFLMITPYLLLLESGIAGYRGFSSWMRYLSLAFAVLGAVGLLVSLVLPRLLRR